MPSEKNRIEKNNALPCCHADRQSGRHFQRALKVLSEVDFIMTEDTRVTLRCSRTSAYKKPLISYFEHNEARAQLSG